MFCELHLCCSQLIFLEENQISSLINILSQFAVLYEARANTGINKMKIIDTVAKSVPSPHKVDLSNPEINIVVQIVKVHIFAYKCVL